MTREEIDIRSLELDIKETKLNRDEIESQKLFDDRRAEINLERNDLDIKSMEMDVAEIKEKQ